MRRIALALTAMSLAFGCGGEGTDERTEASAPFSVAYGPWTLSEEPVFPRAAGDAWDGGLVDPGAMIFHDGWFHMLYNGIRSWPSPLWIGYATSADGVTWERRTGPPVLAPAPVPFGGWTVRATSVIVEDDVWSLYFAVGLGEGDLEGVIGRATAPAPAGPWLMDTEPVLVPGGQGAWDEASVGHAKVMPDAEGYVMYYTGQGAGGTAIGRAVSADGVSWTRYPEPVLTAPAGDGGADGYHVSDPTVVRTPEGGWLMVYRLTGGGGVALGTATSTDGLHWTPGAPVTRVAADVPFETLFYSNVQSTRTHQRVYFEAGDAETGETDVWMASREVVLGPP